MERITYERTKSEINIQKDFETVGDEMRKIAWHAAQSVYW